MRSEKAVSRWLPIDTAADGGGVVEQSAGV